MQTNNLDTSSCQEVVFCKKHYLVKKINSKIEKAICNVYKIADEVAPECKVIVTFANRAYKGKSYLLRNSFKILFEQDLTFLSEMACSKSILNDLRINYYYFI